MAEKFERWYLLSQPGDWAVEVIHRRPGAPEPRPRDFGGPIYHSRGRAFFRYEDGDYEVYSEAHLKRFGMWPPEWGAGIDWEYFTPDRECGPSPEWR